MKLQNTLANETNSLYPVNGKTLCEIGCGDGNFLGTLAAFGAKAIGYEPSRTIDLARNNPALELHNEYFDPSDSKIPYDVPISLFAMRHVLEHIPNAFSYLKQLMKCYKSKEKALFIEVPDTSYLLKHNLFFDFYFDHIYYFTPDFIQSLMRDMGWKYTVKLNSSAGEFMGFLSTDTPVSNDEIIPPMPADSEAEHKFAENYDLWRTRLLELLHNLRDSGATVAAYGVGSRGVTMLTSLGDDSSLRYVVDSDKNKHGRYLPILGLEVCPPEILQSAPPDYLLITSYTYFIEISESLENPRSHGMRLIRPYPHIEIV